MELAELVACAPRPAGDWRSLASMIAAVLLVWAFAPTLAPKSASRWIGSKKRSKRPQGF